MREQLLGYLLGALDTADQEAVESRLAEDPELRRELELLRKSLTPLEEGEELDPPPGLSARTCEYVMARRGPQAGQFAASSQWRAQDLVVAGGLFFVAAALFFPAVLNSRYNAQLAACSDNLRQLGRSLFDYSNLHGDEFPVAPTSGNLAAAGMYAPTLLELHLIQSHHVVCPASTLAGDPTFRVPRLAEVQSARGTDLKRMHRIMGGSYGYSLGYVEHGKYRGHRNQSRSTFALMADMPGEHAIGSANHGSDNHGGGGQNVLFEDGHVRFLKSCHIEASGDHVYQNKLGYVGAGIGPDDSVISASDVTPIVVRVLEE